MPAKPSLWRRIGPRAFGLALMLKVGLPVLMVLGVVIGGTVAAQAVSQRVQAFQQQVQAQIAVIEGHAAAMTRPLEAFQADFAQVMRVLRPVTDTVGEVAKAVGSLAKWLKLPPEMLHGLSLPFPDLGPVMAAAGQLKASTLALTQPLQSMYADVQAAYTIARRTAMVAGTVFALWVLSLVVVHGRQWQLDWVRGWRLLRHGPVPALAGDAGTLQQQIDALRATVLAGSVRGGAGGGARGQGPWWFAAGLAVVAVLALWLLLASFQRSQQAWIEALRLVSQRDAAPHTVILAERPPPTERGLVGGDAGTIVLDDELLFDSGSAAVRADGDARLRLLAPRLLQLLGEHADTIVLVSGHTDDRPIHSPQFASNWELSSSRAAAVARRLVAAGVPADRVVAAGFGASRPRARNDVALARQLNRRIELMLVPATTLQRR